MKKIIRCPHCSQLGKRQNLAELMNNGMVSILRRGHGQYAEYTVVGGKDFYIVCGTCGNKVYIKNYRL